MSETLEFSTIGTTHGSPALTAVRRLLRSRSLLLDDGVHLFVIGRLNGKVVACAGLQDDIVKCVALDESVQGQALLPQLMTEVSYVALDAGFSHLFLYTKPAYEDYFADCGFYPIVTVPEQVVMMENTPMGVHAFAEALRHYRRDRAKVGACVINANPFTLGHQHLLRTAAQDCDYLHVFVVSEDASFFPFRDRFALVQAGVAVMPERDHIHVHPGTRYIVSKATFPTYFLKDSGLVDLCATAVDLLIFREYIAPALGITHRYVGTEPFCPVTRQYNADMHHWLEEVRADAPPVTVVEVPRLTLRQRAISATEVRSRLQSGDLDGLADLVPGPTFRLLRDRFGPTRGTLADAARKLPVPH